MRAVRTGTMVWLLGLLLLLGATVASGQEETSPPAAAEPQRASEPTDYGRDVPLAELSEPACRDVYDMAVHHCLVSLNYEKADRVAPEKTAGLTASAYLVRKEEGGERGGERVLIVGLKSYATQAPRIYLWGAVVLGEATRPNPDVQAVAAAAEQAADNAKKAPRALSIRDLSHEVYQLGCIDMQSCMQLLGQLGYNTKAPGPQVKIDQLPAIFEVPAKAPKSIVGGKGASETQLDGQTLSAPEDRLMILYHSSQSEEVARLRDLLAGTIDVPERQVLIEAMVIELTEDTLREMGVEWGYRTTQRQFSTFKAEGEGQSILKFFYSTENPEEFMAKLTATLQFSLAEGSAEILSRPSILVLNNQNAMIRVGRKTPILDQTITANFAKVKVRFEDVGIVLNIKPRVSEDDTTIAMQIIAEVSEMTDVDWIVVPSGPMVGTKIAPFIDRRIVETVARVRDNTPFIIGGLIRNRKSHSTDRVPILSRIPLLGWLFQNRKSEWEKREVIIVITPRVMRPGGTHRPVQPKDTSRFDFLDNRLFRNSYRLKAEDIFDLAFLERNETILEAFERVRKFVARHPEYAQRSPFKEMVDGVIPGEDSVAIRMVYEVVKKLGLHERLDAKSMIFFEKDPEKPAGFGVTFLDEKLLQYSPDGTLESYFEREYPKEVLFFRYKVPTEGRLEEVLASPVAEVEVRKVQDRDEVEDALLDINRLHDDYAYHEFAFVLDTDKDLTRLRRALVMHEVAKVNNFEDMLLLRNFRVGRRIVIPQLGEARDRTFLVDQDVAEFFFKSDYYYEALAAKLKQAYRIIEETLAMEGF